MSKNLIYIVATDSPISKIKPSEYTEFGLKTWEYYCNKHNIDLIINTEHDDRFKYPVWNKELIYEIGKNHNKIGIVDSDTMIKWDTENIFDIYNDEFCAVEDNANLGYSLNSIQNYNKFFPKIKLELHNYFNAGVLFFTKKHLDIFKDLLDFYLENKEELDNWSLGGGREQTLLNFFVNKHKPNFKKLSPAYNLYHLPRKDILKNNWQLKEDATPFFIKYGKIWHFTGFPVEQRKNLMSQTWNIIKNNYK